MSTCFNCGEEGHVHKYYNKPRTLCRFYYSMEHSMEEYPQLVAKWEEK